MAAPRCRDHISTITDRVLDIQVRHPPARKDHRRQNTRTGALIVDADQPHLFFANTAKMYE